MCAAGTEVEELRWTGRTLPRPLGEVSESASRPATDRGFGYLPAAWAQASLSQLRRWCKAWGDWSPDRCGFRRSVSRTRGPLRDLASDTHWSRWSLRAGAHTERRVDAPC